MDFLKIEKHINKKYKEYLLDFKLFEKNNNWLLLKSIAIKNKYDGIIKYLLKYLD